LLNRLLDLEEDESIFLAEESLKDLLSLPVTEEILDAGLDADSFIEIPQLGIALHLTEPTQFWLLLTDKYSDRKILKDNAEKWKDLPGRRAAAEEKEFFFALAEYFSKSLMQELFCEECSVKGAPFFVKDRIERLKSLIDPIASRGASILEICCGSGMATQALFRLGQHPIAMDSDRCDLCQSLKSELMNPESCFVLDARLLPRFFMPQSFQIVMGFMVGLIDDFNWPLWRDILLKASSLAKEKILFTTYTQKEAELIAKALGEAGWQGRVIDNRDPFGIYDQWAYYGQKIA
jgi:hypothetical protein